MFRLELEIEAEEPFSKELTFRIVPRSRRIGSDSKSVFGTHAILFNPHFPKLAAQMGIRWSRMWGGNISNATLWRTVKPELARFEWHDEQVLMARDQNLNLLGPCSQKTATSCKHLWLRDFCHRVVLRFRPTSIALLPAKATQNA